MEQKYVCTLLQKVCPVCGKHTDYGIGLSRKFKEELPRATTCGFELCEEHKKFAEGNNAQFLIEAEKTDKGTSLSGRLVCMRKEAVRGIAPSFYKEVETIPDVAFMDKEAFAALLRLCEDTK